MPALWRGQALWQPLISLLKNKKGNRTPGRNYNLAGFEELKIMADVPRHKNEHKWNSSGAGQGEKSSGDHSYLGKYSKNHISHKHAFISLQLQNEKKNLFKFSNPSCKNHTRASVVVVHEPQKLQFTHLYSHHYRYSLPSTAQTHHCQSPLSLQESAH